MIGAVITGAAGARVSICNTRIAELGECRPTVARLAVNR